MTTFWVSGRATPSSTLSLLSTAASSRDRVTWCLFWCMQVAEGRSKQLQALQAEADQELKCQREQLQLKANAELQTLVKVRRAESSTGAAWWEPMHPEGHPEWYLGRHQRGAEHHHLQPSTAMPPESAAAECGG